MILSKVAVAALIISAASGPSPEPATGNLSVHQKHVAARVFVRQATECIVENVASDARFQRDDPSSNLGDLIVDSVPKCLEPVHAMIDVYDRSFGEGAGEEFFMGPYLDVLPDAVLNKIRALPH